MNDELVARLRAQADYYQKRAGDASGGGRDCIKANLQRPFVDEDDWYYQAWWWRKVAHRANLALDLREAADLLSRSCEGCKHRYIDYSVSRHYALPTCTKPALWVGCDEMGNGCNAWEARV